MSEVWKVKAEFRVIADDFEGAYQRLPWVHRQDGRWWVEEVEIERVKGGAEQ